MEITVTKDGNAAMLSLSGQLDAKDAPKLAAEIKKLKDITDLALDLDGLTYLSTAGLGEIVRAQTQMNVSLIHVSKALADFLRMTGLYGRIAVYEKN